MTIMVTGGSGFIGSNFIEYVLNNTTHRIVNIDALTYAGVSYLPKNHRYTFYNHDIGDNIITDILEHHTPNYIVNFAAETHVDNSIKDPFKFLNTNILSTYNFICSVQEYFVKINPRVRFLHISTDEVYGSLSINDAPFTETSQYNPTNPYSATKASADHLIHAFHNTYKFPAIIANCSNNYGPRQHLEKFIPTVIINALNDQNIPIYGNGLNMREWLYVKDNCKALFQILMDGRLGDRYNVGGNTTYTNLYIANSILMMLNKPTSRISFVDDRPGHDFKYSLDSTRVKNELGWSAETPIDIGLKETVDWYINNIDWIEQCKPSV